MSLVIDNLVDTTGAALVIWFVSILVVRIIVQINHSKEEKRWQLRSQEAITALRKTKQQQSRPKVKSEYDDLFD